MTSQLASRACCAPCLTCGPYEKQQQNQGRLLQEQKLELQHLRHQLQEVRTSSLVLVQGLEQELEQALALVLELALDQGLELELDLDQGLELELDLDQV